RGASTLSPGERVLLSAASQAPVPLEGNIKTCPVSVLNIFFSSRNNDNVSSGNLEDRWSSIATIIARITRSGTLVGPETNRKLRPGLLGIGVVSSLRKQLSQSHRHSYMDCGNIKRFPRRSPLPDVDGWSQPPGRMERNACISDSCVPTHSRTESAPIPLVEALR